MRKQIMTHIVAGYPTMKKCEELAVLMAEYVDFIEIQIPFSDPVADGPTIMKANQKALENGVKVEDCLKLMERLSKKLKATSASFPSLLFMTYFNILHHYGVERFCKRAKDCGCWGLIVPDMPVDEEKHEGYLKSCKRHGLMPIQVISPLTPEERLTKIGRYARGFVYCVARYGTTGQSAELCASIGNYLRKVKKYIRRPLAVGFGVSNKEHVQAIHKYAEIAVIGSKIIDILDQSKNLESVRKFLSSLR